MNDPKLNLARPFRVPGSHDCLEYNRFKQSAEISSSLFLLTLLLDRLNENPVSVLNFKIEKTLNLIRAGV